MAKLFMRSISSLRFVPDWVKFKIFSNHKSMYTSQLDLLNILTFFFFSHVSMVNIWLSMFDQCISSSSSHHTLPRHSHVGDLLKKVNISMRNINPNLPHSTVLCVPVYLWHYREQKIRRKNVILMPKWVKQ